MPDFVLVEDAAEDRRAPLLQEELSSARELISLLSESYADLENMYAEDAGWQRLGSERERFTHDGRKKIAALADLAVTGNALIKRGFLLRAAYIWGDGGPVVQIRDDGSEGQDLNAVWKEFWDEPSNKQQLTSSEAMVSYERKLATGGEAFWALPTDQLTGKVKVRRIPAHQITNRITDPDDEAVVMLFKRKWTAVIIDSDNNTKTEDRITYYPALGYSPDIRPKTFGSGAERGEIRWDAPMRHVAVNIPNEDWRGLGDVLAAMPWARMDKEFLEDLAIYMRALTRVLGQITSKSSRTRDAARVAMQGTPAAPSGLPQVRPQSGPLGPPPGSMAVTDPNTTMSLLSKSGAQIDSNSSKPFATRAASALEVPVTMLLGDPGTTGARSVAETLDQPTELSFGLRRDVHADLFADIADYVIDRAVIAPLGPLTGFVAREGDRLVVTLPEGDDRAVQTDWPEYDSVSLKDFVDSVVEAESLDLLPKVEVFKLLARVFKLEDADDLVDKLTDDEGRFTPLDTPDPGADPRTGAPGAPGLPVPAPPTPAE